MTRNNSIRGRKRTNNRSIYSNRKKNSKVKKYGGSGLDGPGALGELSGELSVDTTPTTQDMKEVIKSYEPQIADIEAQLSNDPDNTDLKAKLEKCLPCIIVVE
mgnify:CR=1 FL=1